MSDLSVTINADTTKFISAVKESKKELDLFDKSNKQLRSTMMKVNDVTEEQVNAFKNSVISLNKVSSGTKNTKQSISILKDEVKKLSIQFNNLSDAAKKSKFGDTISNQVRKARTELERLKNIDKELKNSTIIKKDSELFKGVGDSIKDFSSLASAFNSGGLVSALGNLAGPLSVLTAGIAGFNEVIKKNETLLDRWQGIMSGAGNAWTNFMRTFNFSTIGASFTAGQKFYDVSDTLESYRALNVSFLGSILDDSQKAKTDKSEGKPWSKEQIENLKKRIGNYYDQEIKMIKETATAKRKTLLSGLKEGSLEQEIAKKFFTEFGEADNKYGVLETYKEILTRTRGELNRIEEKAKSEVIVGFSSNDEDYWVELEKRKNELKKEYKGKYALVEGLSFLVDSESDLNEFVKLLNDEKKSSQEKQRLIKEINEAVITPKNKEDIKKDIKKLHERNDILKKEIEEAQTLLRTGEESSKKVDLTKLQKNIKEVEDNRKEMANLYSTFESSPVVDYWKLVTDFDNTILKGPEEMEVAFRGLQNKVNEYVKKYAELGYSVDNLWVLIEESRGISDIYGGSPLNSQPIGLYELERGWDIYSLSKKDELYKKNLRNRNKIIESLQKQGIRPYPAFVFDDYKTEQKNSEKEQKQKYRINLLGLETDAVKNLASAWNNLGEVISIENDKIETAMKAFGNFVADTANMLKSLAENELAASEAVALGKATSSASGLPFPYNLVAMATVAASVTSMFARFASIGKFAEGGIVGGSSLGGDQMIARVNSGEMILNGSQQKKLFNLLNGNGTNTSTSIPEIKVRIAGSDLVGVLDNYGKKLNRVR